MSNEINQAVEQWCAVPAEMVEGRDKMLARAKFCQRITSADGMQRSITLAGDLKRMAKAVEERRRELLKPIEAATKRLNEAIRGVTEPMMQEARRIEGLAGEWKRQDDARIARERREAEERAALERKLQEEAERKAREAGIVPPVTAIPSIGTLISHVPAAPNVIRKVEGASVTSTWDFEVTDVWALAQHDRSAVDISVRKSVVNAWIRAGAREIPGCRVFEVTKVTAR